MLFVSLTNMTFENVPSGELGAVLVLHVKNKNKKINDKNQLSLSSSSPVWYGEVADGNKLA